MDERSRHHIASPKLLQRQLSCTQGVHRGMIPHIAGWLCPEHGMLDI